MKDSILMPQTGGKSYAGIHGLRRDTMVKKGVIYWKDKYKTLEMDYGMDITPDVMYESGALKFTTRRSYNDIHRKKSIRVASPKLLPPMPKKKRGKAAGHYGHLFAMANNKTAEESVPKDWKGILKKAESLFQEGEFEKSLVLFHQGRRIKPGHEAFRLGVGKCEWAISSSFYELSQSLPNIDGTSKGMVSKQCTKISVRTKKLVKSVPRASVIMDKPLNMKKHSTKNRPDWDSFCYKKDSKTKRKLVKYTCLVKPSRFLKNDKEFLEDVLLDIDPKIRMGAQIQNNISEAIDYIDTRNRFWTQQIPRHAKERAKAALEALPEEPEEIDEEDPVAVLYRYVCKELVAINEVLSKGQHETIERAKALVATIMESDVIIPGAGSIIASCFCMIGNAYLDIGENKKALAFHLQDMQMASEFDLPEAKSRALDNVGRVYARTGNYDKAIGVWQQKLPLITDDIEMAWICHEIGYCYLELKRYEDSKFMGQKCLQAAQRIDDKHWQLNGSILVAQSTLRSGDAAASYIAFERAYEYAKDKEDEDAISKIEGAMNQVKDVMAAMEAQEREVSNRKPRKSVHIDVGGAAFEDQEAPPHHHLDAELVKGGMTPSTSDIEEESENEQIVAKLAEGDTNHDKEHLLSDTVSAVSVKPVESTIESKRNKQTGSSNIAERSIEETMNTIDRPSQTKSIPKSSENKKARKKAEPKKQKQRKTNSKAEDPMQKLLEEEEKKMAATSALDHEDAGSDHDEEDKKILDEIEQENKKLREEKLKKEREKRRKKKLKKQKRLEEKRRLAEEAKQKGSGSKAASKATIASGSATPAYLPNDSVTIKSENILEDTDTLLDKQFGSRVMTASTELSVRDSDIESDIHTENEFEDNEPQEDIDQHGDIPVVHAGDPENLHKLKES